MLSQLHASGAGFILGFGIFCGEDGLGEMLFRLHASGAGSVLGLCGEDRGCLQPPLVRLLLLARLRDMPAEGRYDAQVRTLPVQGYLAHKKSPAPPRTTGSEACSY